MGLISGPLLRLYGRALAGACAIFTSMAAQPAAASTLQGEIFRGDELHSVNFTVRCGKTEFDPFTYRVDGVAIGPHPGTFTERGRVVPTPVGDPLGPGFLKDIDVTFAIDSPAGDVHGQKHQPSNPTSLGFANCSDSEYRASTGALCYRATFAGGGTEEGEAPLIFFSPAERHFDEEFFLLSCPD